MGQTIGKQQITREQLLKSTADSRDFTNRLFLLMIKSITPEDILKLSRPQECRNYIFLLAGSIQNLFESLRIRPVRKGDSGVIIYQKIDDLRKKLGPDAKELCLIIAYYYIRIFQIFGSLAISILDDPSAGQVLGAIRFAPPVQQKQVIPGRKGPFPLPFAGGANPNFFRGPPNKEFAPFAALLENPDIDPVSRRLAFRFINSSIILFPGRMDLVTKKYPQNLRMDTDSGNIHIYGNLFAQRITREQEEPRRLKITLSNFRYVNPQIDPTILKKINSQIFVYKVSFEVRSVDFGDSYQLSNGSDFVRHIEDEFDKVSQLASRLEQNPQLGIQDVVGKRVLKEIGRAPGIRDDYLMDRYQKAIGETRGVDRIYPGLTRDIIGVPKSLQNEFMIQTLKSFVSPDARSSQKVVGYCVARALQLLDANTLSLPKPKMGVSSVCLGKFADMPSAVPVSGQTLDKVTGLKALEQLYSTKPSVSQKEEVIVQKDDPAEYAKFLQDISTIFGGPVASSQLTSLDKIIVKDPACPAAAVKQYLQIVDEKSVQNVLGFVNQLFSRQLNHTQKVLKFFREKLFRIIKGPGGQPQIELHPFILKGGIDVLTFLSKEARNILLDYYKGCEETYQKGVQAILAARTIPMTNPV